MTKRSKYIGVIGITVVALMTLSWWANKPSVSNPSNAVSQVKSATTEDTVPYTNDYISLLVPQRFMAKQPKLGSGQPLFVQQLLTVPLQNGGGIFSDQLAIVVGSLPPTGLQEVSDVQLRARSGQYTAVPTNIASTVVYESTDQSIYEIGYFTSNNAQYASIVLTTTYANANLAKEQAKNIVQSLQWLQ